MKRKITSIVLKSIVVLAATVGVIIQVAETYVSLLYFTIQSNIWIGVTCLVGLVLMLTNKPIKNAMYLIKLIFTVSITLTGVVYCTLLAPFMGEQAYSFSSTLLHVVVPVVAIADFLVYDYSGEYKWLNCPPVSRRYIHPSIIYQHQTASCAMRWNNR